MGAGSGVGTRDLHLKSYTESAGVLLSRLLLFPGCCAILCYN